MKRPAKSLAILAAALMLVGCNQPTNSSSSTPDGSVENSNTSGSQTNSGSSDSQTGSDSDSGSGGGSTVDPIETYAIRLSSKTGVTITLDKTKAAEGETVTITVEKVESGYTLLGIKVVAGSKTIECTSADDGKTYTFVMPNQSVMVEPNVEVKGDITLVGDVVAALTLNPETGIYEAKGVAVNTTADMAKFSYQVTGEDGNKTKLDVASVDERKCFANITFIYSSPSNPSDQNLQIASGATYDFFYDPAAERPCYVRRTNVDTLPSNADQLYSLFDGSIRSTSTINTDNLTAMEVKIKDDTINNTIAMHKYADDTTYLTVKDNGTNRDYFVYKHYDDETKQFIVADTYTPGEGNDDPYRLSNRSNTGFSVRYDIDDVNEEGRFTKSTANAMHELNTIPHQMSLMEYDLMYAYRVGVDSESNDEVSYSKINVSSTKTDTGFTTDLDTVVEYNSSEGTYTSEHHEGVIFDVTLTFTAKGELTGVDYTETSYGEDEWNFTSHAPTNGAAGTVAKTIAATYTYDGTVESALPSTFNHDDYFIQEFTKVRFYNAEAGVADTGTNNVLHYDDKVAVSTANDDDELENATVEFAPSTALDLWQYAPTESSDDSIITKTVYDAYNEMTCVGIGTATVTLTNHTKSSGVQHDVEIQVSATKKFHSFSLDWTSNAMVTSTSSASIYVGTTESYGVIVTPDSAPCVYTATVDPTYASILTIESTANKQLVVSSPASANITEPTEVDVRIESEWMDMSSSSFANGYYLTITVLPSSALPTGSWTASDEWGDYSIELTDEAYEGEYNEDYYTSPKKGTIVVDAGSYTDTYSIYYEFNHGSLIAKVYAMETTEDSFDYTADDISMEFEYLPGEDSLSLCMYYTLTSESEWSAEDYAIIGSFDDEGYYIGLPFTRAAE